jgi:hypothetical protein
MLEHPERGQAGVDPTGAVVQGDGRIVVLGTEDFVDGTDASLSRYSD